MEDDHEQMAESYINLVSEFALPKAISRARLEEASQLDPELIEVSKMVNGLSHKAPKELANIAHELTSRPSSC